MICNAKRIILLILVACILLPVPSQAATHTIEVIADLIGDSPEDARNKAIDYAKKRAFYLLLHRLDPLQADKIVYELSEEQIEQQIRGYEIVQERLLPDNRYQAQFNVTLSDVQMQRLIRGEDMTPIDMNAMLILPVLDKGNGDVLLWQDANIWRSLWNTAALERGDGKLVLPFGDLDDTSFVDNTNILTRDFSSLKPLADKYGAQEVAVILASYELEQDPLGVLITIRRMGPGTDRIRDLYFSAESKQDTPETLMVKAARVVADQMKLAAQKFESVLERDIATAEHVVVQAQFRRISQWAAIQEMLKNLPMSVNLEIGGISIQSATATLYYKGNKDTLVRAMRANGLVVAEQADHIAVGLE